ncbi:hypothetical protein JW826_06600 [Candidatus Woesearchaeota archaeon]|nr:hypothetical protein [Candidatus Woesearchaeota archaeon]
MASIPGWAYILIGGVIAGFSKYVESSSTQPGKMGFFFFIGIVFLAIGAGKIALGILFPRKDLRKQANHLLQRTQQNQQKMQQSQSSPHHTHLQAHQAQARTSNLSSQDFSKGTHHIRQVRQQPQVHASVISCPACGVNHYSYAKFCMMCGAGMKRK